MNEQGFRIGKKAFFNSAAVLLALMLLAGLLTQVLPQSAYDRAIVDGRETLLPETYHTLDGARMSFLRVFTAPFEVLASPDAATIISIMLFILLIGGTFLVLDRSGVLRYIMCAAVQKYAHRKYFLLGVLTFLFMLFGSSIGIFEELVTLVPLGVALALSLGWDTLTGLGLTGLAVGFGFATGMFNPFTVGIAQRLSGLPVFSGVWLRAVVFVLIYALLFAFLYRYAKKIERDPAASLCFGDDQRRREQYQTLDYSILQSAPTKRAVRILLTSLLFIGLYILASVAMPALSDYSLAVMAVVFTLGGLLAGHAARYTNALGRDFLKGMLAVLPGLFLIMMAMSIKYIIVTGHVMDTLLHYTYSGMRSAGPYGSALILYAFVLVLQFFIGSGSAKAALIMPIVAPLAPLVGITRQSAVLAFCFGDGYTNMFYPTNAVLLISLSLAGVSYIKWLKWTWKLQAAVLALTAAILLFAVAIGY